MDMDFAEQIEQRGLASRPKIGRLSYLQSSI